MTENAPIWGIHAGAAGEAEALFRKGSVALSWPEMGDLSAIPATREAFKQRFASVYPEAKAGAIPTAAGLLFRFVHEMKPGDLMAWRSKVDRQIHLGRVTGPYRHDPARSAAYPNQRTVTWERELPITQFSQGALYELGSAMSLFQLKNYVEEYRAAMAGAAPVAAPEPAEDETAQQVAGVIEQST